ncbi:hypothetical protein JTM09_15590, partial [Pseudomonas aeruginosa]|nr:hypothetical protein [Pseudomonas aeruginosa]MBN0679758.1 hypothetical protein [Pseudomonas aeruginosa]MBN0694561.1 hypothetical protein [Pseudomonas aeruginosa]MBN0792414.1 hypothetical protein [Pseudomonas aeruginosa]MBN0944795.1 hypothetical protein [Pseudomonas aeruginosa]
MEPPVVVAGEDRLESCRPKPEGELSRGLGDSRQGLQSADSVEKVSFSGSLPIKCAAVEMAASHFKLPSGVSLSVLAPV